MSYIHIHACVTVDDTNYHVVSGQRCEDCSGPCRNTGTVAAQRLSHEGERVGSGHCSRSFAQSRVEPRLKQEDSLWDSFLSHLRAYIDENHKVLLLFRILIYAYTALKVFNFRVSV